jgi:hypothetical protein
MACSKNNKKFKSTVGDIKIAPISGNFAKMYVSGTVILNKNLLVF